MRKLSIVLLLAWCLAPIAYAANGVYDVVADYSAVGDGTTNNTTAFQNALNQASSDGGGLVTVPTGDFLLSGTISIPANVTLQGVFVAPSRWVEGTVLLTTTGHGSSGATPFITMGDSSGLVGVTVEHPSQTHTNPPVAYPWVVRGNGSHITIKNVLLLRPYQGIDLGTNSGCDYHLVENVYMQSLNKGVMIDQCKGGTMKNIHQWPFYSPDPESPYWPYMENNCYGFWVGDAEDEVGYNLFTIFLKYGMMFDDLGNGEGSGTYTSCYMDIVNVEGIRIEEANTTKGLTFIDCATNARKGCYIASSNSGPINMTAGGFYKHDTDTHIDADGGVISQAAVQLSCGRRRGQSHAKRREHHRQHDERVGRPDRAEHRLIQCGFVA